MPKKVCEHCGASMVIYKHSFSNALAEGLFRLYTHGSAVNIKHLKLTRNQWDNFQKLRYWDLVVKAGDAEGRRIGGTWDITQRGKAFVEGRLSIPNSVRTYRGVRTEYEGKEIKYSVHSGLYKTRPEYAEDAEPKLV